MDWRNWGLLGERERVVITADGLFANNAAPTIAFSRLIGVRSWLLDATNHLVLHFDVTNKHLSLTSANRGGTAFGNRGVRCAFG